MLSLTKRRNASLGRRILLLRRGTNTAQAAPPSAAAPISNQPTVIKSQFSSSSYSLFAVAATSLTVGFVAGRYSFPTTDDQPEQHLPNGLPRTCCDDHNNSIVLTEEQFHLPNKLKKIVGEENVLNGSSLDTSTIHYLKGARLGLGSCLCIVTPQKLHHVVEIVQEIVNADCVIVPQGMNTGLTGGSVPHSTIDKRPTVLISMKYLDAIFPIDDGKRVVCQAGVGLAALGQFLETYFPDRESHCVLGSTFLNPTTAAGVAFGSGGTQCRKGPAYTERALYLKITTNKWQEKVVTVVNTLGIEGMEERDLPPGRARKQMDSIAYMMDTWGRWIKEGYEREMKYSKSDCKDQASETGYAAKLCRHNSKSVSRYNADVSGPDPCRSEGKVIILATVHDTFPKPKSTKTFWLSFDSLETALAFRKEVALDNPNDLPLSLEYMDRDSFDVVDRSGRILAAAIKLVGTSSSIIRKMWNIKLWIEGLPVVGASHIIDKGLHTMNNIFPATLPRDIMKMGKERDHHVALTVGEFGDGNMDRFLDRMQQFASKNGQDKILIHECRTSSEDRALTAFRFVAAPAFRTWCIGEGAQGFSVDYALPKNCGEIPPLAKQGETAIQPIKRMRYSHFACNVVHEDLAYNSDADVHEAKFTLKKTVEQDCGGKLPAEHGHGTEYQAPIQVQKRWKAMDPLNVLNPGVGGLSEKAKYED